MATIPPYTGEQDDVPPLPPSSSLSSSAAPSLLERFKTESPLRRFTVSSPHIDMNAPEQAFLSPGASAATTAMKPSSSLADYTTTHPIKVETVSGWRKQRSAETSLGQYPTSRHKVLIQAFTCDICSIGVGPDHHEQELYLYPVYTVTECLIDDDIYFNKPTWLHICGGCARNKRRRLSDLYLMVKPEYWLTTILLTDDPSQLRSIDLTNDIEILQVRRLIAQHMLSFYRFHLFLLCLSLHLPLHQIFEGLLAAPPPPLPAAAVPLTLSPSSQEKRASKEERKQKGQKTPPPVEFGSFAQKLHHPFSS